MLYIDGEHESMLTQLDHLHHETRGQTIARLEAALAYAKAAKSAKVVEASTPSKV